MNATVGHLPKSALTVRKGTTGSMTVTPKNRTSHQLQPGEPRQKIGSPASPRTDGHRLEPDRVNTGGNRPISKGVTEKTYSKPNVVYNSTVDVQNVPTRADRPYVRLNVEGIQE